MFEKEKKRKREKTASFSTRFNSFLKDSVVEPLRVRAYMLRVRFAGFFVLFGIFIERSYKNVSLFLPKVCWYCCCLFTNTGFLTHTHTDTPRTGPKMAPIATLRATIAAISTLRTLLAPKSSKFLPYAYNT